MKNILEIELKSSFKYQVIFFISAMMHSVFLATFMLTRIYVLMTLNIISVLFYLIALQSVAGGILKTRSGLAFCLLCGNHRSRLYMYIMVGFWAVFLSLRDNRAYGCGICALSCLRKTPVSWDYNDIYRYNIAFSAVLSDIF